MAVVEPHGVHDRGRGFADEDVEVMVVIDVLNGDGQRGDRRFERNALRDAAGDRELDAVVVAGATGVGHAIGDREIRDAIVIEISDRARPSERARGGSEMETVRVGGRRFQGGKRTVTRGEPGA